MTKRKKKSTIPSSKRGPQRSQAKSPTSSSVTMNSEDSWSSSPTSTSRSPTPDLPQNEVNKTTANKIKTSRIPPIFVQTGAIYPWRKIAKTLFTIQGLDQVTAKTTSVPLQIQINCPEESSFRLVQQFMTTNKINFHTFVLPEEQSLKIVIKGVPLDVTDEELMNELQEIGFKPNFVRAFAKMQETSDPHGFLKTDCPYYTNTCKEKTDHSKEVRTKFIQKSIPPTHIPASTLHETTEEIKTKSYASATKHQTKKTEPKIDTSKLLQIIGDLLTTAQKCEDVASKNAVITTVQKIINAIPTSHDE
ncbi:hypothetical protein QTP88_019770 [Uroleucon formosanum]